MKHKSMFDPSTALDMSRFTVDTRAVINQRNDLLKPFVDRLNASRKAAGYKPYTSGYVASKMSHIATDELEYHYKQLEGSKNFCALWHWYNVPKKK